MNKQNRDRLIETENRLTAVRGEGDGGQGAKGEGIKQKNKNPHRLRQQYGYYRGKSGWREVGEGKGVINGDERRLYLRW